MSDITPVEQLVAAEEKRQREHATLNAAPLSAPRPSPPSPRRLWTPRSKRPKPPVSGSGMSD